MYHKFYNIFEVFPFRSSSLSVLLRHSFSHSSLRVCVVFLCVCALCYSLWKLLRIWIAYTFIDSFGLVRQRHRERAYHLFLLLLFCFHFHLHFYLNRVESSGTSKRIINVKNNIPINSHSNAIFVALPLPLSPSLFLIHTRSHTRSLRLSQIDRCRSIFNRKSLKTKWNKKPKKQQ